MSGDVALRLCVKRQGLAWKFGMGDDTLRARPKSSAAENSSWLPRRVLRCATNYARKTPEILFPEWRQAVCIEQEFTAGSLQGGQRSVRGMASP